MKLTEEEMRKLNQSAGYHFFDEETMSFFNSKIETCPSDRYYLFITSEYSDKLDQPKRYTLRRFNPETYEVDNITEFHSIVSLEAARRKKSFCATDKLHSWKKLEELKEEVGQL